MRWGTARRREKPVVRLRSAPILPAPGGSGHKKHDSREALDMNQNGPEEGRYVMEPGRFNTYGYLMGSWRVRDAKTMKVVRVFNVNGRDKAEAWILKHGGFALSKFVFGSQRNKPKEGGSE